MRQAVIGVALLMLAVCAACGGARPMLVTPSPTEDVTATRPSDVSRPVPSPVGTRTRIPFPPATLAPIRPRNETSTAASLPGANETSTAAILPAGSETSTPAVLPVPVTPTPSPSAAPTYEVLELNSAVMIGDAVFPAELATNSAERAQGLSGRQGLEPGTGMLFIFEDREASSFWMRNMLFSLDFVWISEDCRVVDITPNVPFPKPETSSLPSYRPSAPAAYNLEINGGEADKFGISIGDAVRFTGIPDHIGDTCER